MTKLYSTCYNSCFFVLLYCEWYLTAPLLCLLLSVPLRLFIALQCIEQLGRIQAELQDSVKDLAKSKKKYFELEQMAQAVREKADIEAK